MRLTKGKKGGIGGEPDHQTICRAEEAYSRIASLEIYLDPKPRDEHIVPLLDGLGQFKERVEL